VDENLIGSVIKGLHPWLSSFDDTYLFCCQVYFYVNQYWSHKLWCIHCCLS